MHTALVVRALEVLPPQNPDRTVCPPKKEGNDDVKGPGTHDLAPNRRDIGDIERGHGIQSRHRRGVIVIATLGDVDGNHDQTADDAHKDKDVAAHLGEPQKDGGVQADGLDQLGLAGINDGFEPGEESPAHRGRGVFLVGMLDLGSVDERVTGSNEGEEEGEDDEAGDGGTQRYPDGTDSELDQPGGQ